MKKVLVLYFSGAGSTRKIVEMMAAIMKSYCEPTLLPVDQAEGLNFNGFDAFIIGTPVYHGAPAHILTDFFVSMDGLENPKPAFIYNTRATWSCNTNRILAKKLLAKGIFTVLDRDYRSPASDGSLIVPFVDRFFEFENGLEQKAGGDCMAFLSILEKGNAIEHSYIPRLRFSSIINGPNKLAGQLVTFPIYLHKNRCIKCHKCIDRCPRSALIKGTGGYPVFKRDSCENCYRCIHHCPAKALSLSRRRTPERLLQFNVFK